MAITLKLWCLAVTFVGVMYAADGLKCAVCTPKSSRVSTTTQSDATRLRNEIQSYHPNAKECEEGIQFKAQLMIDSDYSRECNGGTTPWCMKYASTNWTARTCRYGTNYRAGCSEIPGKIECYCNNKDKCNSASGLHGTVATIIYAIISALALNKFI